MNTTIIIPNKIQSTAPKPTKTQISEALLFRARKAHEEKEAVKKKRYDELKKKIEDIVLDQYLKAKPNRNKIDASGGWKFENPASITIQITSPRIRALQKELKKLQHTNFDEWGTKEKIKEGMKAPNPLINNDSTAKALDALLATMMTDKKVIDNTVDA